MDQETEQIELNYKDEQIEFLLEESSMMNFLEVILPSILPDGYALGVNCHLRPHQGKNDLKKSIPTKVKTFSNFYKPAKLIIIHDQDSNDCKVLKKELLDLCAENGDIEVLVRIPCRELENWYLGDMNAIESVYPKFIAKNHKYKAKFRSTDNCQGSYELEKLIPTFQKGYASRNIPKHFSLDTNKSVSFNQLVSGIQNFLS